MNASRAGAQRWMRAHASLSQNFYEALHEGSRSTRIERDGDALFAVINDVTFDFAFDASDVATLWVSVRNDVVISARRQPLRSVDRLHELLRDQADELLRIARKAAERVDCGSAAGKGVRRVPSPVCGGGLGWGPRQRDFVSRSHTPWRPPGTASRPRAALPAHRQSCVARRRSARWWLHRHFLLAARNGVCPESARC